MWALLLQGLLGLYLRRSDWRKNKSKLYHSGFPAATCQEWSANFGKLLEQNGLRHIRFHDLRHSCASLLLANDVPLKQIQEWLGHSDISTTANIYSHLDYKSKLTSANVMDNVLTLPETEAVGWQT